MDILKATKYFQENFNLPNLKLLPQNVKKVSKPARLVNNYGYGDPNSIIWLYDPSRRYERYVGVLIRKNMLYHDEVLNWANARENMAGQGHMDGKEYRFIPFI